MSHPLLEKIIVREMLRAWRDSDADVLEKRHEEGGYIVKDAGFSLAVERWPRGERSAIVPPPWNSEKCYNGKQVVAAFHTHPNPPIDETGREWDQSPSRSDMRWHAGKQIFGFLISRKLVYEIDITGKVYVTGKHEEVLQP